MAHRESICVDMDTDVNPWEYGLAYCSIIVNLVKDSLTICAQYLVNVTRSTSSHDV
jgi:hypothetical protein